MERLAEKQARAEEALGAIPGIVSWKVSGGFTDAGEEFVVLVVPSKVAPPPQGETIREAVSKATGVPSARVRVVFVESIPE